jgi:hypothetical protein
LDILEDAATIYFKKALKDFHSVTRGKVDKLALPMQGYYTKKATTGQRLGDT